MGRAKGLSTLADTYSCGYYVGFCCDQDVKRPLRKHGYETKKFCSEFTSGSPVGT